jgi:NAD+ synthase
MLVGSPWLDDGTLHNSVILLDGGKIQAVRHKVELPNYGVFDEVRVFRPGPLPQPVDFRGVKLGLPICEDVWFGSVAEHLRGQGAEMLLVPNGSPYTRHKRARRSGHMQARVRETGLPLIYVNQVGGQDELVFDGASFALAANGEVMAQLPPWREHVALTRWQRGADGAWTCNDAGRAALDDGLEAVWNACVLGLRDYVGKNRFPGVVLGLSGGIDSAVVAAMAVDALGAGKVHCIMLPYAYTSSASLADARDCAGALGVRYDTVDITPAVAGFNAMLKPLFAGLEAGVTEENIQSRSRGVALMAISNKLGSLVVSTGNKSEMSVGYATLYGDMNGGFNPIKDIYKSEVFDLARWRNIHVIDTGLGPAGTVIPPAIISKPPSAELRPDQTDQDSLPPYEVLDAILTGLVEEEKSVAAIIAAGYDEALVRRIEHLLAIAEYKRRQAAPGVKISTRNFGRGRRYPITNGFRDPK